MKPYTDPRKYIGIDPSPLPLSTGIYIPQVEPDPSEEICVVCGQTGCGWFFCFNINDLETS